LSFLAIGTRLRFRHASALVWDMHTAALAIVCGHSRLYLLPSRCRIFLNFRRKVTVNSPEGHLGMFIDRTPDRWTGLTVKKRYSNIMLLRLFHNIIDWVLSITQSDGACTRDPNYRIVAAVASGCHSDCPVAR
jgi:hypothetical protein